MAQGFFQRLSLFYIKWKKIGELRYPRKWAQALRWLHGEPLSDAASPMHGQDRNGPTAVILSLSKPDYTLVSCGTVLKQEYAPSMFTEPGKRARLLSLIKVYFQKGGQEIQINTVSREVLAKAMENPDDYHSLVVRVSGFSAYFTGLDKCVQEDILLRTEH